MAYTLRYVHNARRGGRIPVIIRSDKTGRRRAYASRHDSHRSGWWPVPLATAEQWLKEGKAYDFEAQ